MRKSRKKERRREPEPGRISITSDNENMRITSGQKFILRQVRLMAIFDKLLNRMAGFPL
jgi:hypothetical protein